MWGLESVPLDELIDEIRQKKEEITPGVPRDILEQIICPGCGAVYEQEEDLNDGACPKCRYENGLPPFRLLTVQEILEDNNETWNDVSLGAFVRSLLGANTTKRELDHWPESVGN